MCQTKYLRCEFYHVIARLGAFYEIGRHNCLALKKKKKKVLLRLQPAERDATRRRGEPIRKSNTHTFKENTPSK